MIKILLKFLNFFIKTGTIVPECGKTGTIAPFTKEPTSLYIGNVQRKVMDLVHENWCTFEREGELR